MTRLQLADRSLSFYCGRTARAPCIPHTNPASWVGLSNPCFMFSVRRRSAKHPLGKVMHRRICCVACDTPRKSRCDFLQLPAVAVRITERNKRPITEVLRVWAVDSDVDVQ